VKPFKKFRKHHDEKGVVITSDEREALLAAIDLYLSGMDDARTETIQDPTLYTPEMLLTMAAGYDETQQALISVQRKLEHVG